MKLRFAVMALMLAALWTNSAQARPFWTEPLFGWRLVLVEGVAYITTPELPDNCSPKRAAIRMSGSEYDKAIYQFVLNSRNDGLRIVIDDAVSECVVLGVQGGR